MFSSYKCVNLSVIFFVKLRFLSILLNLSKMKKPPIRLWIAVMIFFTTFTNYMLRSNMTVSIIDMVDRKSSNFTPACRKNDPPKPKVNKTLLYDRYKWTEGEVGHILAAYFYGYIVTVIPGGALSEYFGPWHVILWSSVACGVATGFTPLSAKAGPYGVFAMRFLTGFFGGVAYPAVNVIIAKWAPPKEKGKFLAAMMGNTLGSVVAINLVGWVTALWGWPWGFYVLVILMGMFCTAFAIIVTDTPHQHRWISDEEKQYIIESQEGHVSTKKKIAPYLKIFLSIPFWVCTIAQFANLWCLNLIVTYVPKFMSETLGFNLKASAGLSSIPYIARLILSSVFGAIGDRLLKKEILSKAKIRKIFIIFSHFIPALCLMLIGVVGCNYPVVVFLIVLNQGLNGALVITHLVNPQDLAPNFAGTVYGIMNFIGMTTGFFVPTISGQLLKHYKMGFKASNIIFLIGGSVFAFGGLIFMIFSSTDVQPWNEIKEDDKKEENT